MSEYSISQIFADIYPEDAAFYCNSNGLVIKEIEPEDGHRRFQIQEAPAPTQEEMETIIRRERNRRLSECDLISPMRWNAMTALQQAAWTQYRVDLLNIPQQSGFPWGGDISAAPWPTKPE